MPDRNIKCVDCGNDFVFTDREQEWYREKGLSHEPRRCKPCRSSRKSGGGAPSHGGGGGGHEDRYPGQGPEHSPDHPAPEHPASDLPASDHPPSDHPASDRPPSDRPGGDTGHHAPGDRPARSRSRSREMHIVACATCGKETEVPFKPDTTRPVYCRDCYVARGKKR